MTGKKISADYRWVGVITDQLLINGSKWHFLEM